MTKKTITKFNPLTPNLTVFTDKGKQYITTGKQVGRNGDGVAVFEFTHGTKKVRVSYGEIDWVRTYEFYGDSESAEGARHYLRVAERNAIASAAAILHFQIKAQDGEVREYRLYKGQVRRRIQKQTGEWSRWQAQATSADFSWGVFVKNIKENPTYVFETLALGLVTY